MRLCFGLILLLAPWASGELRIRDYNGDVKVTRVVLDSLSSERTYYLDVDGDGRRDTVQLYFEQVGYHLSASTAETRSG